MPKMNTKLSLIKSSKLNFLDLNGTGMKMTKRTLSPFLIWKTIHPAKHLFVDYWTIKARLF